MPVQKIATSKTVCISENASLFEVSKKMKKYNVGAVVVVKDAEADLTPVGIITDRDIVVELVATGVDPNDVYIKEILVDDLMTVKEGSSVQEAISSMKKKGVRRVPIVNEENKVVGIVSMDDLLMLMVKELCELVDIVRQQHL
ncbi:MAG: putative signal-transduction protein with domain [Gammaproteobacteria bacterium]|jgi:CBS domain-containing protein|nr:putative signal-transduction protein with domain [Gammaproteobacteria bacterium]